MLSVDNSKTNSEFKEYLLTILLSLKHCANATGILTHATRQMNFEDVMLSEISQTQKDKYHMIPLYKVPCVTKFIEMKSRILAAAAAKVASVMSDSVRPHRRQPTRLPRPWDSPGTNTGVGCHFLLQCMKVKSESGYQELGGRRMERYYIIDTWFQFGMIKNVLEMNGSSGCSTV